MKRLSGLSGDYGGGKLAHIRLIRGPHSPLTFASQSQVAHCLCYPLDCVLSALSRFVQMALKSERERNTFQRLFMVESRFQHRGQRLSLFSSFRENHILTFVKRFEIHYWPEQSSTQSPLALLARRLDSSV